MEEFSATIHGGGAKNIRLHYIYLVLNQSRLNNYPCLNQTYNSLVSLYQETVAVIGRQTKNGKKLSEDDKKELVKIRKEFNEVSQKFQQFLNSFQKKQPFNITPLRFSFIQFESLLRITLAERGFDMPSQDDGRAGVIGSGV